MPVTPHTFSMKQFEMFRSLMNHGSISEAAKAMNLTQSAVTKMLANAEREIGFQLFVRGGSGCRPTPEAEVLYPIIVQIFDVYGGFSRLAHDLKTEQVGQLRVVTNPALGLGFSASLIKAFREDHPSVSTVLRVVSRREIPEMVAGYQVDVGLILFPADNELTNVEPLPPGRFVCVMPHDHPLAAKSTIEASDLARENLISFSPRLTYGGLLSAYFASFGMDHQPAIEADTSASACSLAEAGCGVALVDSFTAGGATFSGLVSRPLLRSPLIEIGLITPRYRPLSRVASAFVQLVRQRLPFQASYSTTE